MIEKEKNLWRLFGVMSKEFFVNLWVTHKCNFRCRYCYAKHDFKNLELSYERAFDIIKFIADRIKPDQKLKIVFHGGEPTLKLELIKRIMDLVEKMIPNKVSYGLTTNGSLIEEDDIDFLVKKFLYDLSISVDGKRDTHSFNRIAVNKKDYYDVIIKNAKKMAAKNPRIRIRMTFDRYNIDTLSDNIIYFIKMGFSTIVPGADIFSDKWTSEDFDRVKEELIKVKDYIKKNNLDINIYDISNEFIQLSPCTAGDDYFSIDSDGKIYPCLYVVGNAEMCIGDIYSGIDRCKYEEIYLMNQRKVEECFECSMKSYCSSNRCLLVNYVTTGNWLSPNLVECNMMNIKYAIAIEEYKSNINPCC